MEFQLRPFTKEDIESIAFYANNERVAANLRDVFPYPYTKEDAKGYILAMIAAKDERQIVRAIEVEGKAVGSIGIFLGNDVYQKSGELGYWIGEAFWGKGVMSEAARQIVKEAFSKFDIERIYAEPFSYNTGSRRVLEKAGFIYEGTMRHGVWKRGQQFDYCMYSILREEVTGEA